MTLMLPACSKKEELANAPAVQVAAEPPAEPQGDPLEEARADAIEKAHALLMPINDQAQLIVADIEAANHRTAAPSRRSPRVQEPETGKIANMPEFRAVLARNQGAMQNCYERALRRDPNLQGRVNLNLLISTNGQVREASARGQSLRDATVTECMEVHARSIAFPRPDGGAVRMNVPYVFNPQL